MASFFRKFVPEFSRHAAPLFEIFKKDRTDPEMCDASGKAIGFQLVQVHGDELKPLIFGGRVLSESEQDYAALNKELLA